MNSASRLTAIKVDAAYMEREARGVLPGVVSCARGVGEVVDGIMALTRSMLTGCDRMNWKPSACAARCRTWSTGWQARVADRFSCSAGIRRAVDSLSPAAQHHPVPAGPGVPDQRRAPFAGAAPSRSGSR